MRETSCDPQLPKAEGSEMDEADKSIAELRRTHFPKGSKFVGGGMEFLRAEQTGSRLGFKNISDQTDRVLSWVMPPCWYFS